MNMELNKIAGAVLGTALAVFGLNEASNIIYHSAIPEKPGYAIEVAEAGTGDAGGGTTAPTESLGTLLGDAVHDHRGGPRAAELHPGTRCVHC